MCVDIKTLLATEFPAREYFLSPILRRQNLCMVHAWRGLGKTQFIFDIAYAVASGSKFLSWECPEPRRVAILDGEMPGEAVQERFRSIVLSGGKEFPPENLKIITPDLQPRFMPNLATPQGQALYAEHLDDRDLIIVDNISTLCRGTLSEKEDQSWSPVGEWALNMRQAGKTVIFVHHSGKGGTQRGTSKKEDILDLVIALKSPSDYTKAEGARFEVHFEKTRGLTGECVEPFEASLIDSGDRRIWTTRSLDSGHSEKVAEGLSLGLTLKEIANENGLALSSVYRINAQLRADGFEHAQELRRKKSRKSSPIEPKPRLPQEELENETLF